jgi:hypothetical protein
MAFNGQGLDAEQTGKTTGYGMGQKGRGGKTGRTVEGEQYHPEGTQEPSAGKKTGCGKGRPQQSGSGGVIKGVINVDEVQVGRQAKRSGERQNLADFVAVRVHPYFHVEPVEVEKANPSA